jgi:Ca-activated chloride channel family protein
VITNWSQLHLMRPEWLWALLPALILAALLWRARNRDGGWDEVISAELLPYLVGKSASTRGPNLLPFILLGWVLAVLAAAGPSWEKIPQPIHQKQDAMVLVLDLSYSMKAGDLSPSRLGRAQQKLLDLLARRREGQTGLVAYAGDSHIVTPLTDDNPTIANLLPVLSPDMMPIPGSDTAAAIEQAIELLRSAGISQGQIVLVTDGVSEESTARVEDLLDGSGVQLTVVGVGTAIGAPIPLSRGGFLKDSSDTIVIPKLDQGALRALASAVGGRYLNIQIDDSDLDDLLSDTALPGEGETLALDRTADAWDDQGYLLILLLLPLVLPLFRRGWVLCLLPVVFLGAPESAQAQTWDNLWFTPNQQGLRALQQGDTKTAAELFEDPEWAGTAAYQGEEFEAATKHFSETDTSNSWYNRGNAAAKNGKLEEAIEAYEESLTLEPDQVDAIENLALLKKMQEQQEQQQEQEEGEDGEEQENEDEESSDQQQPGEPGDSDEPQEGEQNPSDQQQEPHDPSESEEDQNPADGDGADEENEQEQDAPEQDADPEETGAEEEEAAAAQAEEASPEDQEKEQAMEQWLRRIPDDPSGLLREKFKFESQQRQTQGDREENESYW